MATTYPQPQQLIQTTKPRKPPQDALWTFHIDASTFGSNPSSVGGTGLTVWADSRLYYAQHHNLMGDVSNNCAEFIGLMHCLQWCHKSAFFSPAIYTDSDIVFKWANDKSILNDDRLQRLAAACRHFDYFLTKTVTWVGRDSSPQQQFTDFVARLGCGGDGKYQTKESHTALINAYYREAR